MDGRTVTTANPDGGTQVTTTYLDGRTKSIIGTAVTHQYFSYHVESDGTTQWTTTYTGPNGVGSARYQKNVTDFLGQSIRLEQPAFGSGLEIKESVYDMIV